MVTPTTLIVDADGVAFKAAVATQTTYHWDDDTISTVGNVDEARNVFDHLIKTYIDAADAPDVNVLLCFSCPTRRYFRHDLLPSYKANRKGGVAPLALGPLRQWAEGAYPSRVKPNLEADDLLGIFATHPTLIPGRKIMVTNDKDLDQIPGLHLRSNAVEAGVYKTLPDFAEYSLWSQVLIGDAVDNYKGCPGVGPKIAAKVLAGLKGEDQYVKAVWAEYARKGRTLDDMIQQVNVARILTSDTYDFKRKEPKLWPLI